MHTCISNYFARGQSISIPIMNLSNMMHFKALNYPLFLLLHTEETNKTWLGPIVTEMLCANIIGKK